MSLDRMLTLAGFDKKKADINALQESKRQLIGAHDLAISQVRNGHQIDEGFFTGLRAALAAAGNITGKVSKSIARKAAELADNVKSIYQDEKAKLELKELLKAMAKIAGDFEEVEKKAPTILKKDERVREVVKVFRDALETMQYDLQARAVPPEKADPNMSESETKALLDEFLAETQLKD
jgi:hypothetical protein